MTDSSPQRSNVITAQNVSLTNCDREQVHIPGAIQPHGVLFVLEEPDYRIVQVSENAGALLGRSPETLLGTPIDDLVGTEVADEIRHCLSGDFESLNPISVAIDAPEAALTFDGIAHRHGGTVIFELEKVPAVETTSFFDFYRLVKTTLTKLQRTRTLQDLCQIVVNDVRSITGFDRVMVYRFEADGSGVVEAESRGEAVEPFLGLRYPSTDIPAPARRLYLLNWLRLIPDINYEPVGLVRQREISQRETDQRGTGGSEAAVPLDLSHSVLRSVSPLHVEYLKNMGVEASMSISLIKNGALWGLIACHHDSPRYVTYQVRTSCEFLGQAMSLELAAKEENEDLLYKMTVKEVQALLIDRLASEDSFAKSLVSSGELLLKMVNAQGAAICTDGGLSLIGVTPYEEQVEALIDWVGENIQDDVLVTEKLPDLYPPAEDYKAIASGLLALSVTRITKNYILWFRPEVIQSVTWAGDPNKPAEIMADGSLNLSPRQSFERWQETVFGNSLLWMACEIDGVYALKNAIVGTVLRQADAIAELNSQLMTSNDELDSFAYAASHDLKEPLRGIYNYSSFLLEDYAEQLDEEGLSHLQAISKLTQRMENLINSLLHYSRLGRAEIAKLPVNTSELLQEIVDLFQTQSSEDELELQIAPSLPIVLGDSIQIMEVFTNLVSNAIKYNENKQKRIEIGLWDGGNVHQPSEAEPTVTFYVKDNGIGIPEKHQNNIFRLFKRLHSPKKYKGGTGVGLTLVKRIIERHGGSIALKSVPGEGSTFYITLPAQI
ncbi:MAG: ATP-binding protein [Elainellaceae cyanobacterium]